MGGELFDQDRYLVAHDSTELSAPIAQLLQAMERHLRSSMPNNYKNVQVKIQSGKAWMTISFLNRTLGQEYWRLAIQFHRAPDENGPRVVARLRSYYTEDVQHDENVERILADLGTAMEAAASTTSVLSAAPDN